MKLTRRHLAYGAVAAVALWWIQPLRGPSDALPPRERPVKEGDAMVTLATTGATRYHYHKGTSKLPPVVLIHGVSATMDVWRELGAELEAAGRTVLYFDLTGRGYSHDTGTPQTMPYLVAQVEELLAAVGVPLESKSVDMMGWSLGSAIALSFALAHRDVVRKLILYAPPGAAPHKSPNLAHSPLIPVRQYVPFIGEGIAQKAVPIVLTKSYRRMLAARDDGGAMIDFLIDHVLRNPALARAVISSGLDGGCTDLRSEFELLGRTRTQMGSTLVVWCEGDLTNPLPDNAMTFLANADHRMLAGLDHAAHLTHPTTVNPVFLTFLEAQE